MGFEPVLRPLVAINRLAPEINLEQVDILAFTSVNGVTIFSELCADRELTVLTVGEATAQAARDAGFLGVMSADGDVESLGQLIRSERVYSQMHILHPSAEEPAGDLGLEVAGYARIEHLPVYRAVETNAPPPDAFDAVLIHSPRAARALAAALSPDAARGRIACAISANAAAPLSALPFAEIRIAAHPDEASLLACLGKPPVGV